MTQPTPEPQPQVVYTQSLRKHNKQVKREANKQAWAAMSGGMKLAVLAFGALIIGGLIWWGNSSSTPKYTYEVDSGVYFAMVSSWHSGDGDKIADDLVKSHQAEGARVFIVCGPSGKNLAFGDVSGTDNTLKEYTGASC